MISTLQSSPRLRQLGATGPTGIVFPFGSWANALLAALILIATGPSALCQGEVTFHVGSTFRDCPECPKMVVLPAGSFLMGASNDDLALDRGSMSILDVWLERWKMSGMQPQHTVTISRSFAMGAFDVTRAEFAAFVHETGYSPSGGCTINYDHRNSYRATGGWQNAGFAQSDDDPVVCVNWQDAQRYVGWLNTKVRSQVVPKANGPYHLPSEAQWEYAARAGQPTVRWWGNSIGSNNADCDGCGSLWDNARTAPAGSFRPNQFGLYDMLGNVWQWTADSWHGDYSGAPSDGTAWQQEESRSHVARGGCWNNTPWAIRANVRGGGTYDSDQPDNFTGFRIARDLP